MKMKKSELKPYKETLLALRSRLRGDVSTLADAALAKSSGGMGGAYLRFPAILPTLVATRLNSTTRCC